MTKAMEALKKIYQKVEAIEEKLLDIEDAVLALSESDEGSEVEQTTTESPFDEDEDEDLFGDSESDSDEDSDEDEEKGEVKKYEGERKVKAEPPKEKKRGFFGKKKDGKQEESKKPADEDEW